MAATDKLINRFHCEGCGTKALPVDDIQDLNVSPTLATGSDRLSEIRDPEAVAHLDSGWALLQRRTYRVECVSSLLYDQTFDDHINDGEVIPGA